ncbi:hypothetical protein AAC387_Pa07g1597 [Persea americana]
MQGERQRSRSPSERGADLNNTGQVARTNVPPNYAGWKKVPEALMEQVWHAISHVPDSHIPQTVDAVTHLSWEFFSGSK